MPDVFSHFVTPASNHLRIVTLTHCTMRRQCAGPNELPLYLALASSFLAVSLSLSLSLSASLFFFSNSTYRLLTRCDTQFALIDCTYGWME